MADQIVMPRLGDFMTEGTILKWNKSLGEKVGQGEVIVEIESEKLNYELEAGSDGVLHTIANEGDVVPVDGVIGYLLSEGEAPPASQESSSLPTRPDSRRAVSKTSDKRSGPGIPSTPVQENSLPSLEWTSNRSRPRDQGAGS